MNRRLHLLLIAFLAVASCTPKYTMLRKEGTSIRITKELTEPDSAIAAEIRPYKIKLDSALSEVIAVSAQPMEKGTPEGVLGNFVSDACLTIAKQVYSLAGKGKVDFCVLNNGGLRTTLPQGNITRNKIYELMPFENELVCLKLNGTTTRKLLNFIANKGGMPVAGLSMKLDGSEASQVRMDSIDFNLNKEYVVVTSDYLASGGDDMGFFSEAIEKYTLNKKVRDAIMEYLIDESRKGNKITAQKDGRITKQ